MSNQNIQNINKMYRLIIFITLTLFSCGQKDIGISIKIVNADRKFNSKNYEDAIEDYTKIIQETNENDSRKYFCFYKRACSNYYLKNYNKSLTDIALAIQVKNNSSQSNDIIGRSLRLKGGVFSRKNQKIKAVELYKESLEYIQEPVLFSDLGYCLTKVNETEEAIYFLEKSIKLNPKSAYSYSNLGLAYLLHGNLKESIYNLEISEKLDPKNPFVHKHKALYYLSKGEKEKACIRLKKSKHLGYKELADETEKNEVDKLIKENCHKKE